MPAIQNARWRDLTVRALAFAALWAGLSRGDTSLLLAGWVVVPATLYVSLRVQPSIPPRFQTLTFLRFVPGWLWMSLRGSAVVARWALHPGPLPLVPDLHPVHLRIEHPPARLLLSAVVSLVPGTVCTDLGPDGIVVHLLDARTAPASVEEVRRVEAEVAQIFGGGLP